MHSIAHQLQMLNPKRKNLQENLQNTFPWKSRTLQTSKNLLFYSNEKKSYLAQFS